MRFGLDISFSPLCVIRDPQHHSAPLLQAELEALRPRRRRLQADNEELQDQIDAVAGAIGVDEEEEDEDDENGDG